MPVRPGVTAVLVSHDGATWLPDVLAALAAQTVAPDTVVGVDTGSTDTSPDLLRAALGEPLSLPRDTGYGAAVAAGLATAAPTPWIWLLHDDCAPEPDALERLLAHAQDSPSAALLGPKARDWDDPRRLVEVGLTSDAAGRRLTGLDRAELDQGQRDAVRDVLAVGTAGALVRRDVWDAVGGLDPDLPLHGDDLDLGRRVNAAGHRVVVVPQARVRHARALATGRRRADAAPGRPGAVERRHALLVLLAHAPAWRLLTAVPGLLLGALLRALLLLLGRRPGRARDELTAPWAVLGDPVRLRAARRARAVTRTLPASALRPLEARRRDRLRAAVELLADRLAGTSGTGPPGSWPERLRRRPGLLLVLGLGVVALVAERSLLVGGALQGGRLLPSPAGASDLWRAFAAPQGEPGSAVLAALSVPLLGRAPTAVALLVLAAVPLAAAVAWHVAGRVVTSTPLRAWAAATWALTPVATGAVAAGRLDALAVQVALPLLLLGGWSVLSQDPAAHGWHRAWGLGLGLAAVTALAPPLWPPAAVLLVLGGLLSFAAVAPPVRPAARRRALAAALAAAVPLLLLPPWTWLDAADLLHGPGRLAPGLADPALPAWHLLWLQPGGPGAPPLWAAAGLLLGALFALLRTGRPRATAAGWVLVLVGLAWSLVQARSQAAGQPGWPGAGLQLAAAGAVLAVVTGAQGLGARLARTAFGWRQLLAVLVVASAALVPVLCGAAWLVRGADDPLQRAGVVELPAFVRADLAATGTRALVLRTRPDGSVGYAVTGPDAPRLGDRTPADDRLDAAVADLLAPRGSDAAAALATRGVRWVATGADALAPALDAQDGLGRQVGQAPRLWRVLAPAPRSAPEQDAQVPRVVLQALLLLAVAVLAVPGRPEEQR